MTIFLELEVESLYALQTSLQKQLEVWRKLD